jgi:magnesium-transporting ATPase (P-type)
MSKPDEQFELEKQLHEQYAINNNANVGSFVSFVVALLALFVFFGYSFIFSTNQFSTKEGLIKGGILTLDVYYLFTIIVIGMLFFLSLVSLQLGYSNRSNQIIIDRIRETYFKKNKGRIFGKNYSPKKKTWCNFIQDYFNLFYWLFFCGQLLILIFTIYKTFQNICLKNTTLSYWVILVIFVFLIQLGAIFFSLCFRSHYFVKYCSAFDEKIKKKILKESCFLTRILFSKNRKIK